VRAPGRRVAPDAIGSGDHRRCCRSRDHTAVVITGQHATVVDGQVVDDDLADTLRTKAGLAVGRFEAHHTAGREHPTRLTCGHTQPVGAVNRHNGSSGTAVAGVNAKQTARRIRRSRQFLQLSGRSAVHPAHAIQSGDSSQTTSPTGVVSGVLSTGERGEPSWAMPGTSAASEHWR
jgi:hypothetical protein